MLNRLVAPNTSFNSSINPLVYTTHKSGNIPVYSIKDSTQSVVGIELVYAGGKITEAVNGTSYFSTNLLKSGLINYDTNAINNFFELRGAFVQVQNGLDYSSISLYCLSEKLSETLPLFIKLISEPIFPEDQIGKLKKRKIQEIQINEQKSNYWATKLLKESLFEEHPYGHTLSASDVNKISREDILNHWKEHIISSVKFMTVVGSFDLELILKSLEHITSGTNIKNWTSPKISKEPNKKLVTKKLDNSEQESLKMGLYTIGLQHPSYPALSIGNCIWGGYFGSRLMQSIREEKGLTYGIHSSLIHLIESSYLQVSADLKKGAGRKTIELIKLELDELIDNPIGNTELKKVKSFMIGEYKSGVESLFDKISKIKFIKLNNLSNDFFIKHYQKIIETESDQVSAVMQEYVQSKGFKIAIVE